MPNRQILDFATKGIFIESDNTSYEMIEGIVGVPLTQKGSRDLHLLKREFKF